MDALAWLDRDGDFAVGLEAIGAVSHLSTGMHRGRSNSTALRLGIRRRGSDRRPEDHQRRKNPQQA
jgi:hypothetical protein